MDGPSEGVAAEDTYVLMNTETEVEELVTEEVEEIPSIEEPSEVVVAEPLEAVEEPVEVIEEAIEKPVAQASIVDAPICDMALLQESGANMLYAIQLYSGQIHTERLDLAPLLDAIESALKSGPRTIVIEGSSSDGPSTREWERRVGVIEGNERVSSFAVGLERAWVDLQGGLPMKVIARVQPDGTTPEAFRATGTNQASFQYVRVDLKDA